MTAPSTRRTDVEVPRAALTLWRTLLGDDRALRPGRRSVVGDTRGLCPPGWTGVLVLGDRVAIDPGGTTSEQLAALLELDDPSDPVQVAAVLAPQETLGPGELAYLPDGGTAAPPTPLRPGWTADLASAEELAPFVGDLPDEDRAESSLGEMDVADVVRLDGRIVAAAGWTAWPTGVAHVGIAVAAEQRGQGLGAAVGAATVRRALAEGLTPQWRAASGNLGSRALARRLGLVEVGRQFSLRLPR